MVILPRLEESYNTSAITIRVVEGEETESGTSEYDWTTLSLEGINRVPPELGLD
jgi:hypothetical protein